MRDTTPPGEVSGLRASASDGVVVLRWQVPTDLDFDRVVVTRTASGTTGSATVIYRGRGTTATDRGVRSGRLYRYVVVTYDTAGNASGAAAVQVRPLFALFSPRRGALVTSPPLLDWRTTRGATYYNVQLYRGDRKILSRWPSSSRLQLPSRWRHQGRVYRLTPARYSWYVWPGFGRRAERRYGALIGASFFTVRPRA